MELQLGFPLSRIADYAGNVVEGGLGLLASPGQGLLPYWPLGFLSILGLGRLVRERPFAGVLFAGASLITLACYGFLRIWCGGWSWGPRFLVPLLPLLTLAATFWVSRGWQRGRRGGALAYAALATLGFGVACNGILIDFVRDYTWAYRSMDLVNASATHFRWDASPLASGWRLLATNPPDLLLLRMGELGGAPGAVAAVLFASILIGCLAWSGRRIWALLREDPSPA
jgi:hypothetical protein